MEFINQYGTWIVGVLFLLGGLAIIMLYFRTESLRIDVQRVKSVSAVTTRRASPPEPTQQLAQQPAPPSEFTFAHPMMMSPFDMSSISIIPMPIPVSPPSTQTVQHDSEPFITEDVTGDSDADIELIVAEELQHDLLVQQQNDQTTPVANTCDAQVEPCPPQ